MSSTIPSELHYTETHEWVRSQEDGIVTIGITDHAQHLLGDLVFVELPEVGRVVAAAEGCAVVESVKAASDVYSPVSGEVIAVNEALADAPETVNQDAFGDGWLFQVKLSDSAQLEDLLDAEAYTDIMESEEH